MRLELVGLHRALGSRYFGPRGIRKAIGILADFTRAVDLDPSLLNVAAAVLGIAYLDGDEPPSIDDYVEVKVRGKERLFDPVPRIAIEPGRSLVGNAGVTAYRVGTVRRSRESDLCGESTAA